ncbi:hypothetical protein [Robertmurraya korlensis]|uniref:hypothetical protein n=1 Tax=Robertmurraya korlensis TaxID=519977 RepID=UPI000ACD2882|nr:hypothetical protein [Robertmurraya korlensis]
MEKNKLQRGSNKADHTLDRIPTSDMVNSDNAFSETGLENAQQLENSINNKKTK